MPSTETVSTQLVHQLASTPTPSLDQQYNTVQRNFKLSKSGAVLAV